MSEELTVTVRDEVEGFLYSMAAQYKGALSVMLSTPPGSKPGVAEFYNNVLAELEKIAQDYIRGGEPTETEPEPQQIEVGDLVELTGKSWGDVKSPKIGELYVVASVTEEDGPAFYDSNGDVWYVFENDQVEWGAKVHKKASEL